MVTNPFIGKVRLSSMARPKPTTTCPVTETITYFAVTVKLRHTFGSFRSSR